MPTPAQSLRLTLPGRRLLVLQNPGRGSRNHLEGIINALYRLGIQHRVFELQEIWASGKSAAVLVRRLSQMIVQHKIGAVLGYGFNGMSDLPLDNGPIHTLRSFFEIRNIPHLMLWLDHPQWHAALVGLSPQLQGMFRSANCIHFMKSSAHALEMERIVGWPNCFELPPAIDPGQFPVSPEAELNGGKPPFDLVALCTDGGDLPRWLKDFIALEDPDPAAIRKRILEDVRVRLDALWRSEAPDGIRPEVTAMGKRWAALKAEHPFLAAIRHWPALIEDFPGACWFLTLAYPTYMKALHILWNLREWERRFYLAYLAKYCRVGVFGADWSPLKLGPGGFIDFRQQSATYAKGKVALNITDGHDEEGLTLKPFEIAASGIPMLHYHAQGLGDCFTPDKEVAIFTTPREARTKLEQLLDDSTVRKTVAQSALTKVLAYHTWDRRIESMFQMSRLSLECFREAPSPISTDSEDVLFDSESISA